MPVTGEYSQKKYKCPDCGHEYLAGTNHWGDIYSRCPSCGWKHPLGNSPQVCLEKPPEGVEIPVPWRTYG